MIKTYSPNLMVHPLMRQSPGPESSNQSSTSESTDNIAQRIIDMLSRLHALVIGPGLGRDPLMQDTVARVVKAAREQGMPVVLDADALQVVQKNPEIVRGYNLAVLTPNVVEFGRLCKALGVEEEVQKAVEGAKAGEGNKETAKVEALARILKGVTIVQKGPSDFISDGETTLTVDLTGGLKRSGGQGDTLTGSIATFLGWRRAYLDGLWDHGGKLDEKELVRLACYGGCAITRVSHCRNGRVNRRSSAWTAANKNHLGVGVLPTGFQRQGPQSAGQRSHRGSAPIFPPPVRGRRPGRRWRKAVGEGVWHPRVGFSCSSTLPTAMVGNPPFLTAYEALLAAESGEPGEMNGRHVFCR